MVKYPGIANARPISGLYYNLFAMVTPGFTIGSIHFKYKTI